jgi:hypothetical protein
MDRKFVLSILTAAILGFFAVLLLIPPTINDGTIRLPWLVTVDPAGHTQVFGFTLGQTTLAEVRTLFADEGTINLFETRDQGEHYGVEAFFEQVYLQSLRANFVFTLDLDQATLTPMYERGLRISKVGSGARKVKLDPADVDTLLERPIRSITYLPQARLDEDLIAKRFGTPEETRTEPETGIVHWLYPERGMDIARDPKGKVVIQYVNPGDFTALLAPLPAPSATPEAAPTAE